MQNQIVRDSVAGIEPTYQAKLKWCFMDTYMIHLAGAVSTEVLHFSLYAVLSYPQQKVTTAAGSIQTTAGSIQTQPQTTVLPSPPTTTPPPTIATGDSGSPIGAIAGGAVGGIVVIGIAAFAYYRYARSQTSARVEPIQAIEGSGSDDAAHPLLGEGMHLSLRNKF